MTLGILKLLERPTGTPENYDGLLHLVCPCDEDKALCGKDVTDWPWSNGAVEPHCVVCADLSHQACERCGEFNEWP